MKLLKEERGSVIIYFLGLLGLVAVLFLFLTNIGRAFVVNNHVANVAEQAAFAATAVYIERTNDVIEQYDEWLTSHPFFELWGLEPVGELVEERHNHYRRSNYGENQAYIMALNDVLPTEINSRYRFRNMMRSQVGGIGDYSLYSEIIRILNSNEGDFIMDSSNTYFVLSDTDWRIEVTTTIEFERVAGGDIISAKSHQYERTGHGPKLTYLEYVY